MSAQALTLTSCETCEKLRNFTTFTCQLVVKVVKPLFIGFHFTTGDNSTVGIRDHSVGLFWPGRNARPRWRLAGQRDLSNKGIIQSFEVMR
jgi:hypothetical protein